MKKKSSIKIQTKKADKYGENHMKTKFYQQPKNWKFQFQIFVSPVVCGVQLSSVEWMVIFFNISWIRSFHEN